jgi:hypothetical protein
MIFSKNYNKDLNKSLIKMFPEELISIVGEYLEITECLSVSFKFQWNYYGYFPPDTIHNSIYISSEKDPKIHNKVYKLYISGSSSNKNLIEMQENLYELVLNSYKHFPKHFPESLHTLKLYNIHNENFIEMLPQYLHTLYLVNIETGSSIKNLPKYLQVLHMEPCNYQSGILCLKNLPKYLKKLVLKFFNITGSEFPKGIEVIDFIDCSLKISAKK